MRATMAMKKEENVCQNIKLIKKPLLHITLIFTSLLPKHQTGCLDLFCFGYKIKK